MCARISRGLVQLLTTSSSTATKPETASLIRKHACGLGFEGVVSKTRDTPYAPGKHWGLWRKTKCLNR
jgi:ATP-dependent DNA ligase